MTIAKLHTPFFSKTQPFRSYSSLFLVSRNPGIVGCLALFLMESPLWGIWMTLRFWQNTPEKTRSQTPVIVDLRSILLFKAGKYSVEVFSRTDSCWNVPTGSGGQLDRIELGFNCC